MSLNYSYLSISRPKFCLTYLQGSEESRAPDGEPLPPCSLACSRPSGKFGAEKLDHEVIQLVHHFVSECPADLSCP